MIDYSKLRKQSMNVNLLLEIDGNFLLLRPYHSEHGPKVPVTPEYIVLQRVLQKRECMSILTKNSNKHASYPAESPRAVGHNANPP